MTLRFKAQELAPAVVEAIATKSQLVFAKDDGVYFFARGGEIVDGARKHIAYAIGCNPNVDDFDDWWDRARRELGGDDFGEYFDADGPVFNAIRQGTYHLEIKASPDALELFAVPAR